MVFSRKKNDVKRRPDRRQDDQLNDRSELVSRYAFQRNRTLTGSAASNVKSVRESKADLKSPRVKAHHLTMLRRRLGAGLLVVLAISIALAGLVTQFSAEPVVVSSGVSQQHKTRYQGIIEQYLKDQPIERLRFMLNANNLSRHVKTTAPEVLVVKQQGSAGFGKTEFNIVMRTPVAGWSINDDKQYVDETGTAFGRNYFSEPSVEIIDQSGIELQEGETVLSNRFLSFVGQLVGLAKANGYAVTKVVIPPSTTRQVEIRLEGVKYPIKLSIDREVGLQVEDMIRAIKWFDDKNRLPRYVDVRVSGRAFYRG